MVLARIVDIRDGMGAYTGYAHSSQYGWIWVYFWVDLWVVMGVNMGVEGNP
jgi:hypothetical protein